MQNEKKTDNKDDVVVIFVKTSASNRAIIRRRHKVSEKSKLRWVKLLHKRLESMNNTVEGQLFIKSRF